MVVFTEYIRYIGFSYMREELDLEQLGDGYFKFLLS